MMPKSAEKQPPTSDSPLARWIKQAIGKPGIRLKYQLRNDSLHLLCEAPHCPDRTALLSRLIPALRQTDINTLVSNSLAGNRSTPHPLAQIRQIQLYGRPLGQRPPAWVITIDLQHLDRYLEELQLLPSLFHEADGTMEQWQSQPPATEAATEALDRTPTSSLPTLSNRALAKRGNITAIAQYLGETLSALGVGVRVSAKICPYTPPAADASTVSPETAQRLWIACEAPYSPDPSLIAEPITQRLRELDIEGYRDAVILFQVMGETQPDWMLRVDLTPARQLLREWARWGDIEAIQRLLNYELADASLTISTASLADSTLHLFCAVLPDPELADEGKTIPAIPDQKRLRAEIGLFLEALGPQGIHAATLYGQSPDPATPAWVEWLELPAADHPALAASPLDLARQERDWEAIAFLLHRLLNPNVDTFLATGGIRLQLLPKDKVLHIMSEATHCPEQRVVGPAIARFLRQLPLADMAAVRVYGRRSGQKRPLWSYGSDLVRRERLVPQAVPEFAATDAYVNDLMAEAAQSLRSDGGTDATPSPRRGGSPWVAGIQHWLVRSQLFTEIPPSQDKVLALPGQVTYQGRKVALVWGAIGLLLMVQSNWLLSRVLQTAPAAPALTFQPPDLGSSSPAQASDTSVLEASSSVVSSKTAPSNSSPATASSTTVSPGDSSPANSSLSNPSSSVSTRSASPSASAPNVPSSDASDASDAALPLPTVSLKQSSHTDPTAFNGAGFTQSTPQSSPQSSPPPARTQPSATPAPSPVVNRPPAASNRPSPNRLSRSASPARPAALAALPYTAPSSEASIMAAATVAEQSPIPTFNSRQLDDKLKLYYRYLEQHGTPDVLVVGSSRALRGVDPIALEKSLADLGHPDITVFNFGINGATAQVVDLVLRQLLTPEQLPKLIVWADGARMLNSGGDDMTYNGITASVAYQQLVAGTLPLPHVPTTTGSGTADAGLKPVLLHPQNLNTILTDRYKSIDRWLNQQLADLSGIYSNRDRLKHLFQTEVSSLLPEVSPLSTLADSSSPSASSAIAALQTGKSLMDTDGFLSLPIQFNPATYYQKYARVAGAYDSDYENFQISGKQEAALKTLLSFTQSRQIPVVFINLPLTEQYLDPVRLKHEAEFKQYMVNLDLSQPGLIFRDLGDQWTQQYSYFSDPSHLNRYGAFAVSDRIAQDPMIPWSLSHTTQRQPSKGDVNVSNSDLQ